VDREHLLPLGERELLERMDDLDAGVADQDVDPAPGLRDLSIATAIAPAPISAAAACAAARFMSAIATRAPSRA
jgi:hypothetical protein